MRSHDRFTGPVVPFVSSHYFRGTLLTAVSLLLLLAFAPPAHAGHLNLAWDGPTTNADGSALTDLALYRMYFATTGSPCHGASFQEVTATSPNGGGTVTAQLTSLVVGTGYSVQVAAVDTGGAESDCSNLVSAAALTDAPDTTPPTGSILINEGTAYTAYTAVTLSLAATDAVGVVGYFVATSPSPPAAGTAGWVAVTATTNYSNPNLFYTLSTGDGLKTLYAWYKDAANNVSLTASAAITLDQTLPTNGTLTATPSSGQVSLSWSGFSDAGSGLDATTPYTLVFSTSGTPASACTTGTPIYAGTATSYTHSGLVNGTLYAYRVCAKDKAGNISTGATASATPPPDTTAPTGSLTINGGAPATNTPAVTLALAASDAVGVTGYYLSSSATVPTAGATGWVAVGPTPSYSNGSVPFTLPTGDGSKTLYAWYKDAAGNVSLTASAAITLDQTLPTNGTLTATPSSGQVALSWTGFADAGSGLDATTPYTLVFSTGGSPASACTTGTPIYAGTGTSYTHTGRTNGTTYYYRLCAKDKAGNISTGATASATPQAGSTLTITSPTSNPTYSTTRATLTLAGTASSSAMVTSVTWSNSRGGTGVASGTTNWTASGIRLRIGTNVLTVTARDAAGKSQSKSLTVTYRSR